MTRTGQDVVSVNLAGAMKQPAVHIVAAMHATGCRRLLILRWMGICGGANASLSPAEPA